jgi:heptosyltransferase II
MAPSPNHLLIRATNWVGDAILSLPALRVTRARWPQARITLLARPAIADIYARENIADQILPYTARPGFGDWTTKWQAAQMLQRLECDTALLLTNSFESAAVVRLAGIPQRLGYYRDARGPLLTQAVPRPAPGSIPRFEAFYYLELLRQLGWLEQLPSVNDMVIRLDAAPAAAYVGSLRLTEMELTAPVIGVSPGAAYGTAKQYLPERFAEAAATIANKIGGQVAIFGAASERELCEGVAQQIRSRGLHAHNAAGETQMGEFIELAAACRLFLTNDSGAMHIASALGVPTVTVFGATDETATGPTGPLARIIREPVDCAPCLKRTCRVEGHPCMSRVPAGTVADAALKLLRPL